MHTDRIGLATTLTLAWVFAATVACDQGSPLGVEATTPNDGVATMAASVAPARPLTEESTGVLAPVGTCAAGVEISAQGTGTGTQVGRFNITLSWCLDTETGVMSDGAATVVAANGDQIAMAFTGQATSPTELMLNVDVVGGTGRFSGANGALDVTADLGAGGSWTSSGQGWIAY